jgi:hypothetical protein
LELYPESIIAEIEFDFVRKRAATHAVTQAARERLQTLLPFTKYEEAAYALSEVNEVLASNAGADLQSVPCSTKHSNLAANPKPPTFVALANKYSLGALPRKHHC